MSNKIVQPLLDGETPVLATIGAWSAPFIVESTPASTRVTKDGKTIDTKEKTTIRVAPLAASAALVFLEAALTSAAQAGGNEAADELAERILGRHLTSVTESGIVVDQKGEASFSPIAASNALWQKAKRKAGDTVEALRDRYNLILAQLCALSELRAEWLQLADGLPTQNGEVVGHAWDAAKWADISHTLNADERLGFGNVRFEGIAQLMEFIFALKARRIDTERALQAKADAATAAATKRAASKASKKALPPAPGA